MTAWFLETGLCLLGAALIPADVSIRRNPDNSPQRTQRPQSAERAERNRWKRIRSPGASIACAIATGLLINFNVPRLIDGLDRFKL